MSERQTPDIGKIVSLIMENPGLIEEISKLARRSEEGPAEPSTLDTAVLPETVEDTESVSASQPITDDSPRRNRSQLLCALKPYVSQQRAKAIDSMIQVADILDMMKTR